MKMLYFGRRSIGRRHSPVVSCIVAIALLAGGLIALPQSLSSAVAQESKAKTDGKTEAKKGEVKKGGDDAQKKPRRRRGGRSGTPRVVVDRVIRGEVIETVSVYGRLVARQSGVIASLVRGGVAAVQVQIGDRVKKGDVIATLLTNTLDAERALKAAELKEFSAKVRTAGAQLGLAAQELERLERLRRSAAFSVARYQDKLREVERFKSSIAEARAKADQSRAQLMMANINLTNASILAPYDGVISQRHVEAGNYVSVGDKVVTLINDTSLEVEAEIPSFRLGGLTKNIAVTVRPEHSAPFQAHVRAVVPEENPLARTRTVRFVPTLPAGEIRVAANENVTLEIPSGAPRVTITVAKDSILQRRGQTVVFVVEDGKVRMQKVSVGDAFDARFEVKEGLKPGDQVVVRGNERLRNGQNVLIRRSGGKSGRGGKPGSGKSRRGGGESSQRGGKPGGQEAVAEGTGEEKSKRRGRRRRSSED
jgi:RND family efflux transporter MFP subunit